MTKFAAISLKDKNSKFKKSFEKKYAVDNLKKNLKCKTIESLDRYQCDFDKLSKFTKIDAENLRLLAHSSRNINFQKIDAEYYFNNEFFKIFILSNDASETAFAFNSISNDVHINLFELDNKSIVDFCNIVSSIIDNYRKIELLNDAAENIESISDIECELSISILYGDVSERIQEEINETNDAIDELRSDLSNYIEAKWN